MPPRTSTEAERFDAVLHSAAATQPTAWRGHCWFAIWLVKLLQPAVTVDLGVDFGYSSFCLAAAGHGTVFAVDLWDSGQHGKRESNHYAKVVVRQQYLRKHVGINNVQLMKGSFEEAAKTFTQWQWPIDLLHVDGLHTAAAVKEDHETWRSFLRKDGPWVVLFHDIGSFPEVKTYFESLEGLKFAFKHSAGLGVLTNSKDVLQLIERWAELAGFPSHRWTTDFSWTGNLTVASRAMAVGLDRRGGRSPLSSS